MKVGNQKLAWFDHMATHVKNCLTNDANHHAKLIYGNKNILIRWSMFYPNLSFILSVLNILALYCLSILLISQFHVFEKHIQTQVINFISSIVQPITSVIFIIIFLLFRRLCKELSTIDNVTTYASLLIEKCQKYHMDPNYLAIYFTISYQNLCRTQLKKLIKVCAVCLTITTLFKIPEITILIAPVLIIYFLAPINWKRYEVNAIKCQLEENK